MTSPDTENENTESTEAGADSRTSNEGVDTASYPGNHLREGVGPLSRQDALDASRLTPLATDGRGVDRIAGPAVSNWRPAQVEPSDEQIAAHEAYEAERDSRRDFRLGLNAGEVNVGDPVGPGEMSSPARPVTRGSDLFNERNKADKAAPVADEHVEQDPPVTEAVPVDLAGSE